MAFTTIELCCIANDLEKEHLSSCVYQQKSAETQVVIAYGKQLLPKITRAFSIATSDDKLIELLTVILRQNWRFITERARALSYTALPNHPITVLLCSLAHYIAETKNKHLPRSAQPTAVMDLLMPSVYTESFHGDYPSLRPYYDTKQKQWVDIDIRQVVQTHILSRDARSLIPIQMLLEVSTDIDSQLLFNPYFDYQVHADELACLDADEYRRLMAHSRLTQAIFDAKRVYETCLNDQSNLLGHLRKLCTLLAHNDVDHGGTEIHAGESVYAAILVFSDYYQTLGEEKAKIPARLKAQLDYLLMLTSNKQINYDATEVVDTCIKIRRNAIEKCMAGSESILSEIALQGPSKQAHLEKSLLTFNAAKKALGDMLATGADQKGADKLEVSTAMFGVFKVQFLLENPDDMDTLRRISLSDTADLFQSSTIKKNFIRQIGSLQQLSYFVMEVSQDRARVVLSSIVLELSHSLLRKPANLLNFFTLLNTEGFSLVCDVLQPILPRIIGAFSDLSSMCTLLPLEHGSLLCQAYYRADKTKLMQFVQTASSFKTIFSYLSEPQCIEGYSLVKPRLYRFIPMTNDFSDLMMALTPKLRTEVYLTCKGVLTQAVLNNISLSILHAIFFYLEEPLRKDFCEGLKGKLTSVRQYFNMLNSLDGDNWVLFHSVLKDELLQLLSTPADFLPIFHSLPVDACTALIQQCKATPERFCKWDFSILLPHLMLCSRNLDAAYSLLESHLPQTGEQVFYVLKYFSRKHQEKVALALQTRLPVVVTTAMAFRETLKFLEESVRRVIYGIMKPFLPSMIQSEEDLHAVLVYLSLEQRTEVCLSIHDALPVLLVSMQSLVRVLRLLNERGQRLVYEIASGGATVPGAIGAIQDNCVFLQRLEAACISREGLLPLQSTGGIADDAVRERHQKLGCSLMRLELALVDCNPQDVKRYFQEIKARLRAGRSGFSFFKTNPENTLIRNLSQVTDGMSLRTLSEALPKEFPSGALAFRQVHRQATH
jgi:hypothetical protein